MISLDEYQKLVKTRDRLRRQKDQAQGAFDQILIRIRKDTGCETKDQIEELLIQLKKQVEFKLPAFQKAEKEFWDDYGEKLENT